MPQAVKQRYQFTLALFTAASRHSLASEHAQHNNNKLHLVGGCKWHKKNRCFANDWLHHERFQRFQLSSCEWVKTPKIEQLTVLHGCVNKRTKWTNDERSVQTNSARWILPTIHIWIWAACVCVPGKVFFIEHFVILDWRLL